MNKTILICLAAVVVAIVIIALAALRFLRADDADPFDEIPDEPRRPGRAPEDARGHEAIPAGATAMRSAGRPAAERPGRNSGYSEPGYRERPGPDRTPAPDRRTAKNGGQPRSAPAPAMSSAGRPAKSGRSADKGDGPDWDAMSDVDYWAELAADKPFSSADATTVPSAPAARSAGRRGSEQAGGSRRTDQAGGSRGIARGTEQPGGPLPTRSRQPRPAAASGGPAHAPGRYAAESATQSLAALARLASQPASPQPPASQPRSSQPASIQRPTSPPPISQPHQQVRPLPAPLDDDPLTSPSFPAINTSDSRSYRGSRSSDSRSSDTQPGRRVPAAASYNEPTPQFTGYPPPPAAASSAAHSSPPGGYPVQSAATGNPYGSFVSQPPARQDPGYPAYGSQQASGGEGWYSPSGGYRQADPRSNGPYANGSNTYGVLAGPEGPYSSEHPSYPGLPTDPAYYQPAYQAAPYDPPQYGGQDPAYGRDASQGYPGYGNGGY